MIISLEGIGGAGKSTQLELLKRDESWRNGVKVEFVKGVSRKSMADSLRAFEDREKERLWVAYLPNVHPGTDMLAFIAYMNENCITIEEKLKQSNNDTQTIIIFDRYIDTAFTHAAARIILSKDPEQERKISELYSAYVALKPIIRWPDLTIVIDTPLEISEARAIQREGKFYEGNDREGFQIISDLYKWLAKVEPQRVRFVDGAQDADEIHNEIVKLIRNSMGNKDVSKL
ncbi:MAG: hypothetical protein QXS17_03725 [Candidatus Micrarchaeaceae archaeon]